MSNPPANEVLRRAVLDAAGVRVVHLRLTTEWQKLLDQSVCNYPPAIRSLLGQACVAVQLISAQIKFDGRLTLQLSGESVLRTLFVECTRDHSFRGIARVHLADDQQGPALASDQLDLRELGNKALLAVTIEGIPSGISGDGRYQGLVPLENPELATALESYFAQSEQLPTRMLLAADAGQAAGIMVQLLPQPDHSVDSDAWPRVQALFDTLHGDELLRTDGEMLLYRLFHEESPRLLESTPTRFACSCTPERVAQTLRGLGEPEAMAAVNERGLVEVDCQFCGRNYRFDRVEVAQLFHGDRLPDAVTGDERTAEDSKPTRH